MQAEKVLKISQYTYVDMDIHKSENSAKLATLAQLPTCCAESAESLEKVRDLYQQADVFRPRMIDGILKSLKAQGDSSLHAQARKNPGLMKQLVEQYFYCG